MACLLCLLSSSSRACELAGSMEIDPTPLMVRCELGLHGIMDTFPSLCVEVSCCAC